MPSLRINAHSFECPLPYRAGHVCTSSEAAELNKLRTERVVAQARNAINQNPDVTSSTLALLAADFSFTRPPYELPPDPIQREARVIAKSIVGKAHNRNDNPKKFDSLVAEAAMSAEVQAEASRRITRQSEIAKQSLTGEHLEELENMISDAAKTG